MTKLEDIEAAIAELSLEDIAKLRDWFEERRFDERIERDAKAGNEPTNSPPKPAPTIKPIAPGSCDAPFPFLPIRD